MYRRYFPSISKHQERLFFDNAATTQWCKAALSAANHQLNILRANIARGIYYEAQEQTNYYEQARQSIADILNAQSSEIIFCKGTTEALNIAARCTLDNLLPGQGVLISEAEHHSNFLPWIELCKQKNIPVYQLPVTQTGAIDLSKLSLARSKNIGIVALTHCSNVTGVITDTTILTEWCAEQNALLILDGAQMMQHSIPNMQNLNADVYCFSGHKVFASTGIGVLYVKQKLLQRWKPVVWGGGMIANLSDNLFVNHPLNNTSNLVDLSQLGDHTQTDNQWLDSPGKFEAGTPPYHQAPVLAKALEWFSQLDPTPLKQHHRSLFERADNILKNYDFIEYIDNPNVPRQPIFSFNIKGLHPHDVAQLASNLGVCLRAGHHCAKPLMYQLKLNACLRISLCCYNTLEELDSFALSLQKIYDQSKRWRHE